MLLRSGGTVDSPSRSFSDESQTWTVVAQHMAALQVGSLGTREDHLRINQEDRFCRRLSCGFEVGSSVAEKKYREISITNC